MKKYKITVNGEIYEVELEDISTAAANDNHAQPVPFQVLRQPHEVPGKGNGPALKGFGSGKVSAPMPGVILTIKVKVGDVVQSGDVLLVLEAMKLENEITAKKAGRVSSVEVAEGQIVSSGELLVILE